MTTQNLEMLMEMIAASVLVVMWETVTTVKLEVSLAETYPVLQMGPLDSRLAWPGGAAAELAL